MTVSLTGQKEYSLFDFLPADENKPLCNKNSTILYLSLMHCACMYVVNAIEFLYQKQYHHFNAHVGENLCQIRAIQIQMLAKRLTSTRYYEIPARIQSQALHLLTLIEAAINSNIKAFISKKYSLKQFCEHFHISLTLTESTFWLTELHLLSHFKDKGHNSSAASMSFKKMQAITHIKSNTLLKKFLHKMQRHVSKISCDFIIALEQSMFPQQQPLLSELVKKDEIGRFIVPTFLLSKVLVDHYKFKLQPTTLIVTLNNAHERKVYMYHYNQKTLEPYNDATLVILAQAELKEQEIPSQQDYKKQLEQHQITNCILWNMAQHPQYSGKALADYKNNPYTQLPSIQNEFLHCKNLAFATGCSATNPSFFCIEHIYTDNINHVIEEYGHTTQALHAKAVA